MGTVLVRRKKTATVFSSCGTWDDTSDIEATDYEQKEHLPENHPYVTEFYVIDSDWANGGLDFVLYLCSYNASGSKVFSQNITASLKEDTDNPDVTQMLLDKDYNDRLTILNPNITAGNSFTRFPRHHRWNIRVVLFLCRNS